MKVAIVHDWLVTYAGAERVLEQMIICYPNADLFSLVDFIPNDKRGFIQNKTVKTSFIQKLPFARTKYRNYLFLMPLAVEQFDLSRYDLVISSSHAVAKGIITGPNQFHVCMCYSPIRYAWDLQHQYLKESGLDKGFKSFLVRYLLHKIRIWDSRTANGVDSFIAISNFIGRRIKKVYGRESTTIYPPVYVNDFIYDGEVKSEFYFTSSRMVPYKKIDLIVETFTKRFPDKILIVGGNGPDYDKIKSISGTNVKFLGYQSFEVLKEHLAKAKAFVFAAEEDFGIAPLEAQASGTPVIAFAKGGALETIGSLNGDRPTGVLFEEQTVDSLYDAVILFENKGNLISSQNCIENARRFDEIRFRKEFSKFVNDGYLKWK